MTDRVQLFIEREGLLRKDSLNLVAVSGGADSVCLLLLLRQLGYRVEAAHCNFHLRGEESQRDETFVSDLCREHGIELHLAHFDTRAYAELHKVSIEMAARELRYRYFEQLRQDIGADNICVAHHQDDNVETILMNLLRGTGLRGLQGIQPRRGHIVRPLLCVSRSEIEEWLHQQGQHYVTDSTNMVADVVRNKLRLDIIPRLKDVFPQANGNILSTARHIGEAVRVYDDAIHTRLSTLITTAPTSGQMPPCPKRQLRLTQRCDIDKLLKEPSPECLLFEWLTPAGFSPSTIEQIAATLHGEWTSATHCLVSHGRELLLAEKEPERRPLRIPEPGTYVLDDQTKISITRIQGQQIERGDATVCCADAATVTFPLLLRPLRPGDRFRPLGMKGTKLVSDFLTDRHFSIIDKRRQLALCDADGNIIWLVALRMDDRYKVTPQTTETLRIHS